MDQKAVTFILTKDVQLPLSLKIHSLNSANSKLTQPHLMSSEKITNPKIYQKLSSVKSNSDMFVIVQLFDNGNAVCSPKNTSYTSFANSGSRTAVDSNGKIKDKSGRVWDQLIQMPVNISQLSLKSKIRFLVCEYVDCNVSVFGVGSLDLFDDCYCMVRGRQVVDISIGNVGEVVESKKNTTSEVNKSIQNEVDRTMIGKLQAYENGDMPRLDWLDEIAIPIVSQISAASDSDFSLILDMGNYSNAIVYSDTKYSTPKIPSFEPITLTDTRSNSDNLTNKTNVKVTDYDQYRDDPIEIKYRKLERSYKDGPLDRELKPTPKIRDQLNKIINYPSITKLNDFEKNLIWKFRYYLTRDKKSLTKFLKSINWENSSEIDKVMEILPNWVEIDIDDSIELLSKSFNQLFVRKYAVKRLEKASDSELQLYLLQLVQALNYEVDYLSSNDEFEIIGADEVELSPLAKFLISRCVKNPILTSFFYWFIKVEVEDNNKLIYNNVKKHFMDTLSQLPQGDSLLNGLSKQIELVEKLTMIYEKIKKLKNETTPRKIEILRQMLQSDKYKMLQFDPTPLPVDPTIIVTGTIPSKCTVFKSSLSPIKIAFQTKDKKEYSIMFKIGDDLRQDQLIIQIITLMDNLLQNENLDLKLTPYKIIATSPLAGALQFIPNQTLSSVLAQFHGILPFLQHHNPDPTSDLGVSKAAMDNYVKSCAGYCVITYLLGVGDRHLDNLLICPDGHFFHADFGYILGQDPKPFPPLMKLPIQIIEGMGGLTSINFQTFQNYCFIAYNTLRKNSNLILNLFELMIDANIPDIKVDPQRAVWKVQEKFYLEMSEEEATIHFQNLINDSVNAFLPVVIDRLHSLAQYWRA